jgi:RepB DNA-primase from phage plasmid
MLDRGFFLSLRAIRNQLAAMPCGCYLIRLIHYHTRKPFPGERLWTAPQLLLEPTIRFLRARNREGFDIYFRPYAVHDNAGYILLDLDYTEPTVLAAMRANGHESCAVVETSPGHLQAWIQVSAEALPPAVATQIGRHLACLYHADRASADWHHLGRLAGFTNQKPQRRLSTGCSPWVKLQHATVGIASNGRSLVEAAAHRLTLASTVSRFLPSPRSHLSPHAAPPTHVVRDIAAARAVYQTWLNRLQIPQRFSHPDWSIADLWIAKELLLHGTPIAQVKSILSLASPHFPRLHSAGTARNRDPEDYLQRTLVRATHDITCAPFPAREAASATRSLLSKRAHSSS